MNQVPVRFIVGELSEEDVEALKHSQAIISKIILSYEDFRLFNYREGDTIQVETEHGNRLWCRIKNLEIINNEEAVIIIFTLQHHQE
jgi:hypothetical protein